MRQFRIFRSFLSTFSTLPAKFSFSSESCFSPFRNLHFFPSNLCFSQLLRPHFLSPHTFIFPSLFTVCVFSLLSALPASLVTLVVVFLFLVQLFTHFSRVPHNLLRWRSRVVVFVVVELQVRISGDEAISSRAGFCCKSSSSSKKATEKALIHSNTCSRSFTQTFNFLFFLLLFYFLFSLVKPPT